MNTYKTQHRAPEWASQSRIVHSGKRLTGRLNRWSVQLMRKRSRYGGRERRGWTLFVAVGGFRGEVGTR
jgi:hypothetical protein